MSGRVLIAATLSILVFAAVRAEKSELPYLRSLDDVVGGMLRKFDDELVSMPKDLALLDETNSKVKHVNPEHILDKIRIWPEAKKGSPTILCATYTHEKKHAAASFMHRAWGHKCDQHVLFSDKTDIEGVKPPHRVVVVKPEGGEAYSNMWQKIRAMLAFLRNDPDFEQFDYFFFSGDDCFMFPENMRKFLLEPEIVMLTAAGTPLHLGYRFLSTYKVEFLSGAGYVLNKAAVHLIVDVMLQQPECNPNTHQPFEDVYISTCLQSIGIHPRDAKDSFGEDRFIVMSPYHMAAQANNRDYTWWFRDYRDHEIPHGLNIVSRDCIVLHYISIEEGKDVLRRVYKQAV